jgi:large subunit ribosomal protein L25
MTRKRLQLAMETRPGTGTSHSRRDRRSGKVPAVIYGHGKTPKTCLLDEKAWRLIARQNVHLVDLTSDGGEALTALVKDVQFDTLTNRTIHIDFIEVNMDEVITADVVIRARGTATGQSRGGVLEQMVHKLEVKCTPNDLPEIIEVDISAMEIDSVIHIKELALPPNVVAVGAPDQAVFRVTLPRIEEVAVAAPVEGAEVPVVGEDGKPVEGKEGAAPAAEEKKK